MIRIQLTESEFEKLEGLGSETYEIEDSLVTDTEYKYTWYMPYHDILFEAHRINDKYLSKCEEEC